MAFTYKYLVAQKEINHNYARKQKIARNFLVEIFGSEDEAYSTKYWYFLQGDSCNLVNRVLFANIKERYTYINEDYIPPDDLYDEFLEVEDKGFEDCAKYRTYKCRIKTTLTPKEFRKTLYSGIVSSTQGLLAGCENISGVQDVSIQLEGSLEDYEYAFDKVSDTPVVVGDKAYFQVKCSRTGKEALKEIAII